MNSTLLTALLTFLLVNCAAGGALAQVSPTWVPENHVTEEQMPSRSQARAGFYLMSALKLRLIPDFSGGGNMRTELQPAYEFYLLSADGRIYRNSGWGVVTAQNIDKFDFDAARIREPENVGSYTDEGDHVTIRIQGQTIVATVVAGDALRIGNSTYERAGFK